MLTLFHDKSTQQKETTSPKKGHFLETQSKNHPPA